MPAAMIAAATTSSAAEFRTADTGACSVLGADALGFFLGLGAFFADLPGQEVVQGGADRGDRGELPDLAEAGRDGGAQDIAGELEEPECEVSAEAEPDGNERSPGLGAAAGDPGADDLHERPGGADEGAPAASTSGRAGRPLRAAATPAAAGPSRSGAPHAGTRAERSDTPTAPVVSG